MEQLSSWRVLGRMLMGLAGCLVVSAATAAGVYFAWFNGPQPEDVAKNWDRASAEILDYRMVVRMGYHRVHRGASADKLEVRFAYKVNGQRYESTEAGWYSLHDIAPFREPRRAFTDDELPLRRRPLGNFDCYVNPQNPAEAVLFCNTAVHNRFFGYLTTLMMAAFAFMGGYEAYRCARLLRGRLKH